MTIHHLIQPTLEVVTDDDGSNPRLTELNWVDSYGFNDESYHDAGEGSVPLDRGDPRIAAATAWLDEQVAGGLALRAGLPEPVVTFGEDCNPDYLLGSLPLGMAVTLHLHDGPVEVMWLGCNKGVVRYKLWPGFEHGLVVNADDLPGRIIETDWINVSRIEIH